MIDRSIRIAAALGLAMLTAAILRCVGGCGTLSTNAQAVCAMVGLSSAPEPTPDPRWNVDEDTWARWLAETRIAAELPTPTPTPLNTLPKLWP